VYSRAEAEVIVRMLGPSPDFFRKPRAIAH